MELRVWKLWRRWERRQEVGRGTTCYVEVWQRKGVTYAVKRDRGDDPSEHHNREVRAMLTKEYNILRSLHSVHVVAVVEQRLSKGWILLEYVPFCVQKVMRMDLAPGAEERRCLLGQLVEGVAYLHSSGVVHRDLKLDNMMLAPDCHTLKLIDFGHAVKLQAGKTKCYGIGGTEPLIAPEALNQLSYEGYPVDMWSIGIIMYMLFNDIADLQYPWRIARSSDEAFLAYEEEGLLHISTEEHLCRRFLTPDPALRITAAEAVEIPFLQYNCDGHVHERTRRLCQKFWGTYM
ncbi:FAEL179Wp [Eremothecium gossypii FDAG1]|nr:FAEL179Wp [Eremothecium gossypii FDAG1]